MTYEKESISNRGLRGLLLNFRLLFGLHSRIPANEGLPELVIDHLRPPGADCARRTRSIAFGDISNKGT